MAQPKLEKRFTRRFSLELPIIITYAGNASTELIALARDVSSRGVFMYVDKEFAEGAKIEFVMTLPREITLADPMRVQCTGRVLRLETKDRRQGIAVSIDKYDFVS
jgi:hypothetical protein